MKKFILSCICVLFFCLLVNHLHYGRGVYFSRVEQEPASLAVCKDKQIYVKTDGALEQLEIRGVDMGAGFPGHFATDYGISKEQYLRWFKQIQDMGANTVRVYTILGSSFYDAFYEYNEAAETPLYLLHGLWVNDYIQYSHRDAFDPEFLETAKRDGKTVVDILHGKRNVSLGNGYGSGIYRRDISPWVLGYILGVEWEDTTVAYTNHMQAGKKYHGTYMYTSSEAAPFEAMLAELGDSVIEYESIRYGQQRLVAFSNWPTTDPLDYPPAVKRYFKKAVQVDVEHIKTTDQFIAGTFASYHIYPYYPDYYSYIGELEQYRDSVGQVNTYLAYLKAINDHHSIPVIISEFGVPSSRGMAQRDKHTGRNQGGISETQQAQALEECYRDITAAGCAGSIIFTWQDEWFKRTWNTMAAVELTRTPYWSDYQTNEQYFGILSFDPGKERSICYVDGDDEDWDGVEPVITQKGLSLSMQYDEKFIYFLVRKEGLQENDRILIPIDLTPNSGGLSCDEYSVVFERPADFLLALSGKDSSRVLVQERYELMRAMYLEDAGRENPYLDPPAADSTRFVPIALLLQTALELEGKGSGMESYETGKLVYGNANPKSSAYNSLADFCYGEDFAEIKLPWQLLNFSDPSTMQIHDDYYKCYGVENKKISKCYVGISQEPETSAADGNPVSLAADTEKQSIKMAAFPLRGWGRNVTYHERLKPAYYSMQKLWTEKKEAEK